MSASLFNRSTNWIVDRPAITVLLIALITLVAVGGHVAPERILDFLNPMTAEDAPDDADEPAREPLPNVSPFSVSAAHAIVVVESEHFFTPRGAESLRQVVDALQSVPFVRRLTWMDRIPPMNLFGLSEPLLPPKTASQHRFDIAKDKALAHPLLAGQLLSADGRTLILLVEFDFFYIEDNADCTEGLRRVAEEAAAHFPEVDMQFSVTGTIPLYIALREQNDADALKYQLIGYAMIAVMSLVLFRGIAAVVIVAIAPALGVFWTLGILPYFDLQDNPFNNVLLPVLISLVGLTDGVHLMVQIRRHRADGLPPREAARLGVHEVGLACALTSLTTGIGFAALLMASHEIVREFGWCCVLGVTLTFISVVTTIPLLSGSWLGRHVHRGIDKSLIDKNLTKIGGLVDAVLRRPRLISTVGIVLTVFLAIVSLQLKPDERRTQGLPTHTESIQALRKMDAAMGGLEFGYIYVHWDETVADDAPEVLEVVTAVDRMLETEPLIGHPLSIRNLIDALPGDRESENRMSMLELLPPPLKRAYYVPEANEASLSFRVQDIGIAKYGPVFERIEAGLADLSGRHPAFTLELSDRGAVWRWRDLFTIVTDLLRSLTSAAFVIFLVLTAVFKSLRIGLISIIPNLFPLVLAAAFLVVTGQYLEMVSVCAFTVCLGIAVDDTIHFLTRYQLETEKTDDDDLAIRNAFIGVGTALIMTTIVLLAGFATALFSASREHRIFAWMGGITIAAALLGDLTFLPALLARYARRRDPVSEPMETATPSEPF
ncbi:MAG: MMPL family transporter [Planctomycetota bacterium]